MIHKIIFIVKWILIISILEVMLWTCLSLILMQMIILKDNKGFISYLRIFNLFKLWSNRHFIYLFYKITFNFKYFHKTIDERYFENP
jgi:hypothetical protein